MAKFFWSTGVILAALDAGILSVQAVYNTQYINGLALYGPVGGAAHDHALAATLIQFRTADNYRSLVAEDAAVTAILEGLVVSEPMFDYYDSITGQGILVNA
jgi:hypothetical protein